MSNIYKLPLVLEPQPEGGYTVTCPVLPDLITEADTLEEVNRNVADALAAIIEAYADLGRALPAVLKPLEADSVIWTESLIPLTGEPLVG
jgi:antitoxin HicB